MRLLPVLFALLVAACVNVSPAATGAPPASLPVATPAPTQTLQPTAQPTPTVEPTTAPTQVLTPQPATPTPDSSPQTEPTATPGEATPAASPGGGSDRLQLGDYQYVTMADAEWSETGYREFFEPDEGNVVYTFLMQFEGIDPAGSSYNPLYFTLNVNGTEYNYWVLGREPELGSGDLGPGETTEGWLSFQAPLADSVVLDYEPVFGLAGEPASWTVTVNQ